MSIKRLCKQKITSRCSQVLRRTLGLDADTPAVLLVGGGEGMGALEDTVAQIAKQVGARCQVRDRLPGCVNPTPLRFLYMESNFLGKGGNETGWRVMRNLLPAGCLIGCHA